MVWQRDAAAARAILMFSILNLEYFYSQERIYDNVR
jgi:hypothetical protein